jgi:HlyD family secretion protein
VTNYKVHIRLIASSYQDLVVPGKSFPFRPGMSANADIQTKTRANVLAVPLNAVTTRDKNEGKDAGGDKQQSSDNNSDNASPASNDEAVDEVVFVVQKDNRVKKVKVKTAIQDLNYIEIVSGLSNGDQVVTGPYNTVSKILKDGNLITIVAKDKLFEEKKKD